MISYISIGEASRITGLPAKTIRFYEEIKLLTPAKRLENRYRSYSEGDLEILLVIKEARSLGLPLKDIKEVIHLCISKGCDTANKFLRTRVPIYLEEIERKINELKILQAKLVEVKKSAGKSKGQNCLMCEAC